MALQDFLMAAKRYLLRMSGDDNIEVKGEQNYNSSVGGFMKITEKNKTFMDISPNPIPTGVGVPVASAKLCDVQNLLQKTNIMVMTGGNWNCYHITGM